MEFNKPRRCRREKNEREVHENGGFVIGSDEHDSFQPI